MNDRMKTLLAVAVAMASMTGGAHAEKWTAVDYALESSFVALMAADYLQTRQIVEHGREGNPVMGNAGELMPPEIYFPSVVVTHAIVMLALPKTARRIALGVSVGIQVHAVQTNWNAGYSVRF